MRNLSSSRDVMADGISIRVRVRRANCASKLEYGEPQDMVCTIVNWEIGGGRRNKNQRRGFANQFRSSSSSKNDPVPYGKVAPTLFFQARTIPGNTLEACCSLQSVSSYDSLDPSIVSDNPIHVESTTTTNNPDASQKFFTHSTVTYQRRNTKPSFTDNNNNNKRKKTYSLPCSSIQSVEKVSSLFRGYRLFFVTCTKASYELEFENKNGQDIMMAFLQATLPPTSFVNFESGSKSVDASDTASYLSTLDVEKLTERLAERENEETMSERLKRSVGLMVSSIEEMSSSFCGNVCCHGHFTGASVAPFVPKEDSRDPPSPSHNKTNTMQPMMEMSEEKSMQGSVASVSDNEILQKRMYLRDYKLPSGLSVEMPE